MRSIATRARMRFLALLAAALMVMSGLALITAQPAAAWSTTSKSCHHGSRWVSFPLNEELYQYGWNSGNSHYHRVRHIDTWGNSHYHTVYCGTLSRHY
jgi:hypothetical protein